MVAKAKILRVQSPVSGSLPASHVNEYRTEEQHSVHVHESEPLANGRCDFFLLHNITDGSWTAKLAERLYGARFGNGNLRLSLTDWNSARGANTLVEMGKGLWGHRLLGIVVSRAMLREDWPAAQRTIEFLKELAPAEARIVTILKENVTIPPVLRLSEWFDFRNEEHFEETLSDLMSFLREDFTPGGEIPPRSAGLRLDSAERSPSVGSAYSFGVCPAKERILSNLFPVVELPKFVYSAETQFQTESELTEAYAGAGPLPFLLKGSRLYTIEPLSQDSVFAPAVSNGDTREQENFTQWFSRNDRAGWAVELLNNLFRHHAWKRGLRWDKSTEQYYFPRTKPKSVWWKISEHAISREVTAPHMGWIELENQMRAEVQYGWRHQSIRAGFIQMLGNPFLCLEPSWLLTELDGKTPATHQPVVPVLSGPQQQERNGQVLRSLRFWSAVLAKGHHEIRVNTGQAPVRIKLTPLSGFTQFGIPSDQMDYDQLMLTEMEDDLLMPALGPLAQESIFNHEESISSQTLRSSRSEQPQART
jgi:hypothetical protein